MHYRELGKTGLRVSALGLGAASLGDVYQKVEERTGIEAVHKALDLGINLIDVSPFYGYTKAETVLGQALATVPRDRYILCTKAGRLTKDDFDYSPAHLIQSLEDSLRRLKTDYVDVLQLHDVEFVPLGPIIEEALPVLEKMKRQGKIRFYGITGLPLKIFTEVAAKAYLDTILSYCRYTLNDQSLLDILPFLKEKGIGVMNASPLAMGLLTLRGAPDWHFASAEIKETCAKAAAFCEAQGENLSKLALQFSAAHPDMATTIVGTANPDNIARNVEWIEEAPDPALLKQVLDILQPVHNKVWISGRPENN